MDIQVQLLAEQQELCVCFGVEYVCEAKEAQNKGYNYVLLLRGGGGEQKGVCH